MLCWLVGAAAQKHMPNWFFSGLGQLCGQVVGKLA